MPPPASTPSARYDEPYERERRPQRARGLDLEQAAPFREWAWMDSYLRSPDPTSTANPPKPRFAQGDHVAIIGPTGVGKTHIAFSFAEMRAHSIVIACKPDDPLIDDATRRGYWLVPTDELEIPYVDGKPLHNRVVYWPRLSKRQRSKLPPDLLLRAERTHQRPRVAGALGYVRNEKYWCVVLDEGTWVCRDLSLQRDVDSALFQFRSLDASMVILGQRPSWMGQYVMSQPTHFVLFQSSHTADLKSLGDISGVDTRLVQDIVRGLDFDRHEALYLNTRRREMFRTIAPPR
jgi:hypothetical protein